MRKLLSVGTVFLFALALGFFGSSIYVEKSHAAIGEPAPSSCLLEWTCQTYQFQNFKGTNGPCPEVTIRNYSRTARSGECCGILLDTYCCPY